MNSPLIYLNAWFLYKKDGEIRTRILSNIEKNPQISLQMVAEEYERIKNLRYDTTRIEESYMSKIIAIKQK